MLSLLRVSLLTLFFALDSGWIGETWQIDLRQWGYQQWPKQYGIQFSGLLTMGKCRYIDFDLQGNVVVGFVARDTKDQSGINKLPELQDASSLKWHTLTVQYAGHFSLRKDNLDKGMG
jgi:hypothetical protein